VSLSAAKVAVVRPRTSPRPSAMVMSFFICFFSLKFDDRFVFVNHSGDHMNHPLRGD
jgi:hypothetical protein